MESLKILVSDIVNGTLNGTLKWRYDTRNMWNSETSYYFTNTLSDGVTKLTMKVETNKDFTLNKNSNTLIIFNPNFKGDFVACGSSEYPSLIKLNQFLYDTEVVNILPLTTNDKVALDILNNNKEFLQTKRDDKINYLLGKDVDKNKESTSPKEPIKKNSIFNIFFKTN